MYSTESLNTANEMFAELMRSKSGEVSEHKFRDLHERFQSDPDSLRIIESLCTSLGLEFIHTNGSYYVLSHAGSMFAKTRADILRGGNKRIKYYTDTCSIIMCVLLYLLCGGNNTIRQANEFVTIDIVIAEVGKYLKELLTIGESIGYPHIKDLYAEWDQKPLERDPDSKFGNPETKQGIVEHVWKAGIENVFFEPDRENTGKIRATKRCLDIMPYVLSRSRAAEVNAIIEEASIKNDRIAYGTAVKDEPNNRRKNRG